MSYLYCVLDVSNANRVLWFFVLSLCWLLQNHTKFLCVLPHTVVALSVCDAVVILFLLPVLWMTSKRRERNSRISSDLIQLSEYAPWAKFAVYDCRVCRWEPSTRLVPSTFSAKWKRWSNITPNLSPSLYQPDTHCRHDIAHLSQATRPPDHWPLAPTSEYDWTDWTTATQWQHGAPAAALSAMFV